jgi:hypothetical protein
MKTTKTTTNGKLNGNATNGKRKFDKPISKMTVDELAENFEPHELLRMALERRKKNIAKGLTIE